MHHYTLLLLLYLSCLCAGSVTLLRCSEIAETTELRGVMNSTDCSSDLSSTWSVIPIFMPASQMMYLASVMSAVVAVVSAMVPVSGVECVHSGK